jgi:serine/threonine protein kinase
MKTCPLCATTYPSHQTNCTADGAMLIESRDMEPGFVVRDKYRIERVLGRGGMGTVYLAEHILLGRLRALKFMSSDLSQDPKFLKRFRREALATIELHHHNVVGVVDLDQAEDGSPFIAMEYVEGLSLREALADAPFPVERSLAITRGVASGLVEAHSRGIVHRDIKPENILLARETGKQEVPKVLDFGIAAMKESTTEMSLTHGLLLTPAYAAPEQWKGMAAEDLDGRVDLYALGGVLYEMLTGRSSFRAHNTEGWMYQHLHTKTEAPSGLRPELSAWPGLDALVLRLLAKDRANRTATAEELVRELDALQQQVVARSLRAPRKTTVESSPLERATAPEFPTRPISDPESSTVVFQPSSDPFSTLDAPTRRALNWRVFGLLGTAIVLVAGVWLLAVHHKSTQSAQDQQDSAGPQSTGVEAKQTETPGVNPGGSTETKPNARPGRKPDVVQRTPPPPPSGVPAVKVLRTTEILYDDQVRWHNSMFVQHPDAVTERATGLMWRTVESDAAMNWKEAAEYCKNFRLDKYYGWRLPMTSELYRVHDTSDTSESSCDGQLRKVHVKWDITVGCGDVWAREGALTDEKQVTGEREDPTQAFMYDFKDGLSSARPISERHYALCVRDHSN